MAVAVSQSSSTMSVNLFCPHVLLQNAMFFITFLWHGLSSHHTIVKLGLTAKKMDDCCSFPTHSQYTHVGWTHTYMSILCLGTFDVQNIDATVDNGTIRIMGKFMVNSPAKGYLIIVKCNSSSSPDRIMAVLNTSIPAVVAGLEPNIYNILVYDVEETGLPNETPAVQIEDTTVSQGQ